MCGQQNGQTTPATTSTTPIRQLLGAADAQTAPCHIQHSPSTPTTGLRKRGNDTSRSNGRSGQKAATRRNMRRDERMTVQGPLKKQQPDGMSHRGGIRLIDGPCVPGPTQVMTPFWDNGAVFCPPSTVSLERLHFHCYGDPVDVGGTVISEKCSFEKLKGLAGCTVHKNPRAMPKSENEREPYEGQGFTWTPLALHIQVEVAGLQTEVTRLQTEGAKSATTAGPPVPQAMSAEATFIAQNCGPFSLPVYKHTSKRPLHLGSP